MKLADFLKIKLQREEDVGIISKKYNNKETAPMKENLMELIETEVNVYCDRFKGHYEMYTKDKEKITEIAAFFTEQSEKWNWNVDLISLDPMYSQDAIVRVSGDMISMYGDRLAKFSEVLDNIDEIQVEAIQKGGGYLSVKFIIKDFWKKV